MTPYVLETYEHNGSVLVCRTVLDAQGQFPAYRQAVAKLEAGGYVLGLNWREETDDFYGGVAINEVWICS